MHTQISYDTGLMQPKQQPVLQLYHAHHHNPFTHPEQKQAHLVCAVETGYLLSYSLEYLSINSEVHPFLPASQPPQPPPICPSTQSDTQEYTTHTTRRHTYCLVEIPNPNLPDAAPP